MAIVQTGQQSVKATHETYISKANRLCLFLAAGVLAVGAALAIAVYLDLAKPTDETSSIKQQQLTVQEDPYSIECYADDGSLRVIPYVYTDDALTTLEGD